MKQACDNEPACKRLAEHVVNSTYHGRKFHFCRKCADAFNRDFQDEDKPRLIRDTIPLDLFT